MFYTNNQKKYIVEMCGSGLTYEEVRKDFNEKFDSKRSVNAIRKAYYQYKDEDLDVDALGSNIRARHTTSKANTKLRKELKAVLDSEFEKDVLLSDLENIAENFTFKIYPVPEIKKKKQIIKRAVVTHISDTHFHSMIDSEEMGGLNKYTEVEESRRLAYLMKEVINYKPEHRDETKLYIVLNGDLGAGIIHNIESLPPMTTQFSAMLHLLSQAISLASQKYQEVEVVCTPGNHLRFQHGTNKGRAYDRKWDGFHTMLYVALRKGLDSHENVKFNIPVTPYVLVNILGHNVFISHGDTVMTLGNVGKSIASEKIKNDLNDFNTALGVHIDVAMFGHVHVSTYQYLENNCYLVVNGCMSGVDGFAQGIGILKSEPIQQIFEITPEHPVGDIRFVRLSKADKDSSLDKLISPFKGKF